MRIAALPNPDATRTASAPAFSSSSQTDKPSFSDALAWSTRGDDSPVPSRPPTSGSDPAPERSTLLIRKTQAAGDSSSDYRATSTSQSVSGTNAKPSDESQTRPVAHPIAKSNATSSSNARAESVAKESTGAGTQTAAIAGLTLSAKAGTNGSIANPHTKTESKPGTLLETPAIANPALACCSLPAARLASILPNVVPNNVLPVPDGPLIPVPVASSTATSGLEPAAVPASPGGPSAITTSVAVTAAPAIALAPASNPQPLSPPLCPTNPAPVPPSALRDTAPPSTKPFVSKMSGSWVRAESSFTPESSTTNKASVNGFSRPDFVSPDFVGKETSPNVAQPSALPASPLNVSGSGLTTNVSGSIANSVPNFVSSSFRNFVSDSVPPPAPSVPGSSPNPAPSANPSAQGSPAAVSSASSIALDAIRQPIPISVVPVIGKSGISRGAVGNGIEGDAVNNTGLPSSALPGDVLLPPSDSAAPIPASSSTMTRARLPAPPPDVSSPMFQSTSAMAVSTTSAPVSAGASAPSSTPPPPIPSLVSPSTPVAPASLSASTSVVPPTSAPPSMADSVSMLYPVLAAPSLVLQTDAAVTAPPIASKIAPGVSANSAANATRNNVSNVTLNVNDTASALKSPPSPFSLPGLHVASVGHSSPPPPPTRPETVKQWAPFHEDGSMPILSSLRDAGSLLRDSGIQDSGNLLHNSGTGSSPTSADGSGQPQPAGNDPTVAPSSLGSGTDAAPLANSFAGNAISSGAANSKLAANIPAPAVAGSTDPANSVIKNTQANTSTIASSASPFDPQKASVASNPAAGSPGPTLAHSAAASNGSVGALATPVPATSASASQPLEKSGTPSELPLAHQMLDSAPVPPANDPASTTHLPTDLSAAQMHVGIRTSAFGNVEIHTVVDQSQVGVAIHGDRDLTRWFSAEVGGLEAGLKSQHLNLTGVDFSSNRSGVQTATSFQQGQPRQNFSHTPGSNTAASKSEAAAPEPETEPVSAGLTTVLPETRVSILV